MAFNQQTLDAANAYGSQIGRATQVQQLSARERSLGDVQSMLVTSVGRARIHADRLESIVSRLTGEGSTGVEKDPHCSTHSAAGTIAQFDRLNEDLAAQLVRIEVAHSRLSRLLVSEATEGHD